MATQNSVSVSDAVKQVVSLLDITPNEDGKTHVIGNKEQAHAFFEKLRDLLRYDMTTGFLPALEIQTQKSQDGKTFGTKQELDLYWKQTLLLLDMCYFRLADLYRGNIQEFSEAANTEAMMQCLEGRIKDLAVLLHFAERTGRGKEDLAPVTESDRFLPDSRAWRTSAKYATLDLPRTMAAMLTPPEQRRGQEPKETFSI